MAFGRVGGFAHPDMIAGPCPTMPPLGPAVALRHPQRTRLCLG